MQPRASRRRPERIVSLLASGTELVCALGAGERLVGRSHECDHPAWVRRLPAVSRPRFAIDGSSQEIDARVRALLRAGEPLYEVDETELVRLAPDLLITQTHCEVCAVSPENLVPTRPASLAREAVLALSGGTLEAILQDFAEVARLLGEPEAGDALLQGIRRRLAELARRVEPLSRPRVACLEWIEPCFAMGNWGPELVELAGGSNLLGVAGGHSTTTPFEAVRRADPDVLIVAPCGFTLERTLGEMSTLAAQPGWSELSAVRNGRVFAADGNLYFNRSSPSLFDTPGLLAEMLHPELLSAGHAGRAYRRWP